MYNLPEFKANNQQQVLDFMHKNSFVILTGVDANHTPVATHVPLLLKERDDRLWLQGHIMKKTDHHKAFVENENVLAIFTGPHTYVSASWYSEKREAGTWNYMTVHAKGKLEFKDEKFLIEVLRETTAKYENNNASPSLFENLPEDYIYKLSKAIIAFEIEVTAIDHVFKLSQNKKEETYRNIILKLSEGDVVAKQVAEEMIANRPIA